MYGRTYKTRGKDSIMENNDKLVGEIADYVRRIIKPPTLGYMKEEEVVGRYVPFIAFLCWLSPQFFPFKAEKKELERLIDTEGSTLYLDFFNGGFRNSKSMFFFDYKPDYPETKYQLCVDFRQHFSLHLINFDRFPSGAFEALKEWARPYSNQKLAFASFDLIGDFSEAEWAKLERRSKTKKVNGKKPVKAKR